MAKEKQDVSSEESFEALLEQLETIVGKLEAGERPLDESLSLYESGVASLKRCHTILDKAEKRIRILLKGADGNPELREMELPERHRNKKPSARSTATASTARRDTEESTESDAPSSPPEEPDGSKMPEVQKKFDKSGDQNIDSEAPNAQNPASSTKAKPKPGPGGNVTGGSLFGAS